MKNEKENELLKLITHFLPTFKMGGSNLTIWRARFGVVYHEVMRSGQTITAEIYCA